MSRLNCNGCKFAAWHRTKSGALHPSGSGRCTYEVQLPKLPGSMYWVGPEPTPNGGWINRREPLPRPCLVFQRAPK